MIFWLRMATGAFALIGGWYLELMLWPQNSTGAFAPVREISVKFFGGKAPEFFPRLRQSHFALPA